MHAECGKGWKFAYLGILITWQWHNHIHWNYDRDPSKESHDYPWNGVRLWQLGDIVLQVNNQT